MKTRLTLLLSASLILLLPMENHAQSQEARQLLLNLEKLNQLKSILSDMKKGYQILSKGYTAIKDVSQGNFKMHEVFLDGLMLVNPEIKKYKRVADIITYQKQIVTEYKSAFNRFKREGTFNLQEISYLSKVYKQLFDQSLQNLDELATVITSSKLRMSDDERLQAIDRIFSDTEDKLMFLRSFNQRTSILAIQRQKEKSDVQSLEHIYR